MASDYGRVTRGTSRWMRLAGLPDRERGTLPIKRVEAAAVKAHQHSSLPTLRLPKWVILLLWLSSRFQLSLVKQHSMPNVRTYRQVTIARES